MHILFFFFSSRRRHTRYWRDWSSDVCSSDLWGTAPVTAPSAGWASSAPPAWTTRPTWPRCVPWPATSARSWPRAEVRDFSMATDYYGVLGLARGASDNEIKKAYRRLARDLHPDVNPDPEAKERFQEVTRAYEALTDPEKRRIVDLGGDPFDNGAGGNGGVGPRGAGGVGGTQVATFYGGGPTPP